MPFDYFNTSHLAFGSKLTRAFKQLEKLCSDAEEHIAGYVEDVAYLGQYVNRNYRIPFPNSAENPVQVNQILDIINDETTIRKMSFDGTTFECYINYFNRSTNRFTIAAGSTSLKEGYAFMRESISNINPAQDIIFKDTQDGKGLLLFQYRIDEYNKINIVKNEDAVIQPLSGGINHISNMRIGDRVYLPYTANDYEAILIEGLFNSNGDSINVEVTSETPVHYQAITRCGGTSIRQYSMAYLRPNDTLKADRYEYAWKVIYE